MNMSFGSQEVTMKKLLLRRNPSTVGEDGGPDSEAPTDGLLSSIPTADEGPTTQPTPTHKRKQSDLEVLNGLDLTADVKAAYSGLTPIEQGNWEEDDTYNDNNTSYCCTTATAQSWKATILSLLSPCQLIVMFMVVAVLSSLHAVRSKSNTIIDEPSFGEFYENEGSDEIGEPFEASLPEQDLLEFYNSPDRMPIITSSGPYRVDPKIGGLHKFKNVCLTHNIDAPKAPELDTSSRGLLYFSQNNKSPTRCVPCSKKAMSSRVEDRWDAKSESDKELGHTCGMTGLHKMYAKSIGDYNRCMADTDNHKTMIRSRQNQSPSHVKQVRYFAEPTFLLQFNAHDREKSLFDMLMTYLPHWHKFKSDGGSFPFQTVISHSVDGCLTHSKNWFCELTHQMTAFGWANEIPWEKKDSTMYCFQSLYYNQLEYQRELKHEGLVTKQIMDEFRNELFKNMALSSPRDMSPVWKKDSKIGMKRPLNIAFYANGEDWKGLDKLVSKTGSMKTYHDIEFNLIQDFDELGVAEQANVFNGADAIVMASGEHFANAIFSPDDTDFFEVGCNSKSLTGNAHFMALILGTHQSVSKCAEGSSDDERCVSCWETDSSFDMTIEAFQALLDDIVKRHEQKISFQRDSR